MIGSNGHADAPVRTRRLRLEEPTQAISFRASTHKLTHYVAPDARCAHVAAGVVVMRRTSVASDVRFSDVKMCSAVFLPHGEFNGAAPASRVALKLGEAPKEDAWLTFDENDWDC